MKLVIISDTHGAHEQLTLPEGDILIHCGDHSAGRGSPLETFDFEEWFRSQDYKYKMYIAGNHDQFAGRHPSDHGGTYYLCDSGVELEGIRFWGMPWTPTFFDWYWMKNRGKSMQKVVEQIPLDTEVLITHGPAFGTLDQVVGDGQSVGCQDLMKKLNELDRLQLHCFGHIHEAYGISLKDPDLDLGMWGITTVNASIMNEYYRPVNEPIVVEL